MTSLNTIKLKEIEDVATEVKVKEAWQYSLSRAITNPKQLFEMLQLDSKAYEQESERACQQFSTLVTESFVRRMKPGDINDPLLRQVLPRALEMDKVPAYKLDPLGEKAANPIPGLLHKYQGRALIITNGHCAINCRFCFRRNFSYQDNHLSSLHQQAILNYLSSDPGIEEIILSGGDPLLLNDRKLGDLLDRIASVQHIKRIRIHSRVPIVLPERITDALLKLLESSKLPIIMVIHCNHAQEINEEIQQVLNRLHQTCHKLMNQSVLLKGVNDSLEAQIELQQSLFTNRVDSYYLHVLDKVEGAAHFDLPAESIQQLYRAMQVNLPGYMLPRLVCEEAGEKHKTLVRLS